MVDEDLSQLQLMDGAVYTVGYIQKTGKGTMVMQGFTPSQNNLSSVLTFFKVPFYSVNQTSLVQSGLFFSLQKKCHFLIVTNNGNEDKSVQIDLTDIPSTSHTNCSDIFHNNTCLFTNKINVLKLSVPVKKKDGTVVRIDH